MYVRKISSTYSLTLQTKELKKLDVKIDTETDHKHTHKLCMSIVFKSLNVWVQNRW
jgi:hypothetical protein